MLTSATASKSGREMVSPMHDAHRITSQHHAKSGSVSSPCAIEGAAGQGARGLYHSKTLGSSGAASGSIARAVRAHRSA